MNQIVEKSVDELVPYEKNARDNSSAIAPVAESIKRFGFQIPIVVDKKNCIIAGHTRLLAAKKLGLKKVPCVVADHLTPKQVREFRLADNRVAQFSQWDPVLLRTETDELLATGSNLEGVGLGDSDLAKICGSFGLDSFLKPEKTDEELDLIPDDGEEGPVCSEKNHLYRLGDHRLLCGDATDPQAVRFLMQGETAAMWLSDPPNAIEGVKEDDDEEFSASPMGLFLRAATEPVEGVLADGATYYLWHSFPIQAKLEAALTSCAMKPRQQLIWNKTGLVLGRQDYQNKHEVCFYGWKKGKHTFNSDRKQSTVLDVLGDGVPVMGNRLTIESGGKTYSVDASSAAEEVFPTVVTCAKPKRKTIISQKPVALFAYLVRNSSAQGDVVIDTFAGSGTTMAACQKYGRRAFCMEIDPALCDVIRKRYADMAGEADWKSATPCIAEY